MGNHYDLLFVISNLSRAGTPAPEPCPPSAGWPPTTHPKGAMPQRSHSLLHRFPSRNHSPSHSKHITVGFQNGSLQVALSKTVRRSASRLARAASRRTVSDTALGLLNENLERQATDAASRYTPVDVTAAKKQSRKLGCLLLLCQFVPGPNRDALRSILNADSRNPYKQASKTRRNWLAAY